MVRLTRKALTRLSPASPTGGFIITVVLGVPPEETARLHRVRVVLLDDLGSPVSVLTPLGNTPVDRILDFVVGHGDLPPGGVTGCPVSLRLDLTIAPLLLRPNHTYTWRCFVDDRTDDGWCLGFSTRFSPDVLDRLIEQQVSEVQAHRSERALNRSQ